LTYTSASDSSSPPMPGWTRSSTSSPMLPRTCRASWPRSRGSASHQRDVRFCRHSARTGEPLLRPARSRHPGPESPQGPADGPQTPNRMSR
jgi:hypothetical protein